MTRFDIPLEEIPAGYQRVYEQLYTAAYHRHPCPSNRQLAAASGHVRPQYATEAVNALVKAGLIEVHRGYKARIVILASGQATEDLLEDLQPIKVRGAPRVTSMTRPNTQPQFVRTACTYCGVRSDIGCRHTPQAQAY